MYTRETHELLCGTIFRKRTAFEAAEKASNIAHAGLLLAFFLGGILTLGPMGYERLVDVSIAFIVIIMFSGIFAQSFFEKLDEKGISVEISELRSVLGQFFSENNECLERLERTPPFMRESLYKIFKMEYEKAVNFKFLSNNHKLEMKLLHYSKFDDSLAAKIIEKNVTKRLEKEEKEKIEKKNEAERMYREYLEEHSLPEFLDTGKDD